MQTKKKKKKYYTGFIFYYDSRRMPSWLAMRSLTLTNIIEVVK